MSFQAYIDNIFKLTGKTPEDFKKLAEQKGFIVDGVISKHIKASEIYKWLMEDYNLGLGYARAIHATFKGKMDQSESANTSTKK